MEITINLYASFRYGRFKTQQRFYHGNTVIREIVTELGIPHQDLGAVLHNGVHVSVDTVLERDATISLLPRIGGG